MDYNIHINGEVISLAEKQVAALNITSTSTDHFHIINDHQSINASLLAVDWAKKQFTIEINGNHYQLHIEDEYEQLIHKMGLEVGGTQKIGNIQAPMPGLILDILVIPGQEVNEGDQILILEAMKMENVLKASGSGIIKTIAVSKGDAVEKGQLLIEME